MLLWDKPGNHPEEKFSISISTRKHFGEKQTMVSSCKGRSRMEDDFMLQGWPSNPRKLDFPFQFLFYFLFLTSSLLSQSDQNKCWRQRYGTSLEHGILETKEYCRWMKACWASSRMLSMLWQMHDVEDRRTGGEEEQRMGFSSTTQHTQSFQSSISREAFPVLWHELGTGIPSAPAGMALLMFSVRCFGSVLMVPVSAMGMGILSTTTYTR